MAFYDKSRDPRVEFAQRTNTFKFNSCEDLFKSMTHDEVQTEQVRESPWLSTKNYAKIETQTEDKDNIKSDNDDFPTIPFKQDFECKKNRNVGRRKTNLRASKSSRMTIKNKAEETFYCFDEEETEETLPENNLIEQADLGSQNEPYTEKLRKSHRLKGLNKLSKDLNYMNKEDKYKNTKMIFFKSSNKIIKLNDYNYNKLLTSEEEDNCSQDRDECKKGSFNSKGKTKLPNNYMYATLRGWRLKICSDFSFTNKELPQLDAEADPKADPNFLRLKKVWDCKSMSEDELYSHEEIIKKIFDNVNSGKIQSEKDKNYVERNQHQWLEILYRNNCDWDHMLANDKESFMQF